MYEIRDAVESDIPGLLKIRNAIEQIAEYLAETENAYMRFLVCLEQQQIIAFSKLYIEPLEHTTNKMHYPKISDLNVHPEYQGKGIGTFFLQWMEAHVKMLGCSRIYLNVDPIENVRAMQLYERLGYKALVDTPQKKEVTWYDRSGNKTQRLIYQLPMCKFLKK